jgi:predicted DsbA family dithiol-disulfide isomerase
MAKSLQIVFDFSCPYCYITWNYIKKLKQSLTFDDEWLTWNIHPEVGPEGKNIADAVPNFDRESRRERLNGLGAPVGVAPGGMTFVPDTRLALQALEFATVHGRAREWCDAVFAANFEQDRNIGDKAVLLDLAGRVGLSVAELDQVLASGKYAAILAEHNRRFTELEVEWVPTVFCDGKKILEGAFTYEEAERVIRDNIK